MELLFNGNTFGFGYSRDRLRQRQLQYAVLIGRGNPIFIDACHVKRAAERAIPALAADIVAFLALLVVVLVVFGRNCEDAVLQVQLDVLFFKAGQLSL